MYDVLKAILVDDLHVRAEDVLPTASRTEVGLDSLAAVELSAVLNSRLGIEVHDYELLGAATIADVARLMEERHLALSADAAE
ncbi:acyl carrier protein [Plantactinospora sp. CA-290183]|uniref:acyl carrier protein n=1 Tax=Plantactinospora sp. CA-290183 TaxID=3240006 RepID=UPI003D91A3D1